MKRRQARRVEREVKSAKNSILPLFALNMQKDVPVLQARYNTTLVPEVFLDFVSFREPAKKASGTRVREHKK